MRSAVIIFGVLIVIVVAPVMFVAMTESTETRTPSTTEQPNRVRVEQPWARASIGMSRPAAAYLTIVNAGREPVRLMSVETPVARRAETHRTARTGDVMRMERVATLEVAPSESLPFMARKIRKAFAKFWTPMKGRN